MVDATSHSDAPPDTDRSMELLVPLPSRRRIAIAVVAAFLALTTILLVPNVTYASVYDEWEDEVDGKSSILAPEHQLLAAAAIFPKGWRTIGIESVSDMPGARVNAAWVVEGDNQASRSTFAYLSGSLADVGSPAADASEVRELPQRVAVGSGPVYLIVLWDLVDCELIESQAAPQAVLTTRIGTTVDASLPDYVGPGWVLNSLRELGACP